MNLELNGKTALVCGASKGIGEAIAKALAAEGTKLILLARDEQKLKSLMNSLPGSGHECWALDLNNHQELKQKLETFLKNSTIDILINNTGGPKGGEIQVAKPQEFTDAFHQHILSSSLISQLVIPGMKQKKFGRILNIISISVKTPINGLGVSNTIRAAMASFAKTLSYEVAPFGITVNNLLPGYTKTERLMSLIQSKADTKKISYAEEEKIWLSEVPAGRFGEPSELASLAAFLSSPLAGYINGTSIAIDGGKTQTLS